jgi:hypothetical protein
MTQPCCVCCAAAFDNYSGRAIVDILGVKLSIVGHLAGIEAGREATDYLHAGET